MSMPLQPIRKSHLLSIRALQCKEQDKENTNLNSPLTQYSPSSHGSKVKFLLSIFDQPDRALRKQPLKIVSSATAKTNQLQGSTETEKAFTKVGRGQDLICDPLKNSLAPQHKELGALHSPEMESSEALRFRSRNDASLIAEVGLISSAEFSTPMSNLRTGLALNESRNQFQPVTSTQLEMERRLLNISDALDSFLEHSSDESKRAANCEDSSDTSPNTANELDTSNSCSYSSPSVLAFSPDEVLEEFSIRNNEEVFVGFNILAPRPTNIGMKRDSLLVTQSTDTVRTQCHCSHAIEPFTNSVVRSDSLQENPAALCERITVDDLKNIEISLHRVDKVDFSTLYSLQNGPKRDLEKVNDKDATALFPAHSQAQIDEASDQPAFCELQNRLAAAEQLLHEDALARKTKADALMSQFSALLEEISHLTGKEKDPSSSAIISSELAHSSQYEIEVHQSGISESSKCLSRECGMLMSKDLSMLGLSIGNVNADTHRDRPDCQRYSMVDNMDSQSSERVVSRDAAPDNSRMAEKAVENVQNSFHRSERRVPHTAGLPETMDDRCLVAPELIFERDKSASRLLDQILWPRTRALQSESHADHHRFAVHSGSNVNSRGRPNLSYSDYCHHMRMANLYSGYASGISDANRESAPPMHLSGSAGPTNREFYGKAEKWDESDMNASTLYAPSASSLASMEQRTFGAYSTPHRTPSLSRIQHLHSHPFQVVESTYPNQAGQVPCFHTPSSRGGWTKGQSALSCPSVYQVIDSAPEHQQVQISRFDSSGAWIQGPAVSTCPTIFIPTTMPSFSTQTQQLIAIQPSFSAITSVGNLAVLNSDGRAIGQKMESNPWTYLSDGSEAFRCINTVWLPC